MAARTISSVRVAHQSKNRNTRTSSNTPRAISTSQAAKVAVQVCQEDAIGDTKAIGSVRCFEARARYLGSFLFHTI